MPKARPGKHLDIILEFPGVDNYAYRLPINDSLDIFHVRLKANNDIGIALFVHSAFAAQGHAILAQALMHLYHVVRLFAV